MVGGRRMPENDPTLDLIERARKTYVELRRAEKADEAQTVRELAEALTDFHDKVANMREVIATLTDRFGYQRDEQESEE